MGLEIIDVRVPRYGGPSSIVGLDTPRAVVISNSERYEAGCRKRWWFSHSERLRRKATVRMSFGSGFHDATEDLYRWWQAFDSDYPSDGFIRCVWCDGVGFHPDSGDGNDGETCSHCAGTGLGPVLRFTEGWRDRVFADPNPVVTPEEFDKEAEALLRCSTGYLHRYGTAPPATLQILAVELRVARPILSAGGRVYRSEVPLVRTRLQVDGGEAQGWRFANREDDPTDVEWTALPWYQVGILDSVGMERSSGALWVMERKSTVDPGGKVASVTVDPQTTGYCWLLEHAAVSGVFPEAGENPKVAGYFYDVASSSFQYDPKVLKSGKLSTAKNLTVPSWRFLAHLRREGLDPALYQEHVQYLREAKDPKLYVREWGTPSREEVDRYAVEIRAVAAQLAQARRDAFRARTPDQVAATFPRTALCALPGGSCSYRGLCVRDSVEARAEFARASDLCWRSGPVELPGLIPGQDLTASDLGF